MKKLLFLSCIIAGYSLYGMKKDALIYQYPGNSRNALELSSEEEYNTQNALLEKFAGCLQILPHQGNVSMPIDIPGTSVQKKKEISSDNISSDNKRKRSSTSSSPTDPLSMELELSGRPRIKKCNKASDFFVSLVP